MVRTHIVITIAVAAGAIATIWQFRPPAWAWINIVGLCLLMVGFVCWTIARFQLGSSFTATAQARHLVTHGFYSKFRNPIYLFGSCVIAGVILVIGRPVYLLIFVVIIPMQIQRAKKEAAVLEAAFGEEYRKYRAGTWF
jgi:protein-S-isoprenylcysteine O-methyltransferase Ste14